MIIITKNRFQRPPYTITPPTMSLNLYEFHRWSLAVRVEGGGQLPRFAPYWLHIFVCNFAPRKTDIKTSRNSVYMLSVAVARSSSNESTIRYLLPVLWMTSFSHKTAHVVYCEAYGRGMSVIGRQRREGRSISTSAPPSLRGLPLTDIPRP